MTLQHATSSKSAGPPEGLYGYMSGQKTAWKGLSGCQVSDPIREHHSPLSSDGATWQDVKVPGKVWEVRFCRFFFFFKLEKWYFFLIHNTKILVEVIFPLFPKFSELTLNLYFSIVAVLAPPRASEQKLSPCSCKGWESAHKLSSRYKKIFQVGLHSGDHRAHTRLTE